MRTLDEVYTAFIEMHGSPFAAVRTRDDLRQVLAEAELFGPGHEVTEEHLRILFDCMWAWDADVPDALAAASLRRAPC